MYNHGTNRIDTLDIKTIRSSMDGVRRLGLKVPMAIEPTWSKVVGE
jgi:hypothetical protein